MGWGVHGEWGDPASSICAESRLNLLRDAAPPPLWGLAQGTEEGESFLASQTAHVQRASASLHFQVILSSTLVVVHLCPTLCNPMDYSTPGFPVLHCLPAFTQTHVHWLDDAIQPSHPLSTPLLLLPSIFLSIKVFSSALAFRIKWPKYWSFSFSIGPSSEYLWLISFRIDWFDLLHVYPGAVFQNKEKRSRLPSSWFWRCHHRQMTT